jgi:TonB family protein
MASEIDKDLVRWDRRKWITVVSAIFILQVILILAGSRKTVAAKAPNPKETEIQLSWSPPNAAVAEWLQLQDPMLFAAPNWNGFSASAWMQKDTWKAVESDDLAAPGFLRADEIPRSGPEAVPLEMPRANILLPPIAPSQPLIPRIESPPRSRLFIEGFSGRKLSAQPALPIQYFNDAVGKSVVETVVEADGTVLSARIIEGSGSKKADSDALTLARKTRFAPSNSGPSGGGKDLAIGKLIFDWYALDFSQTNNVPR